MKKLFIILITVLIALPGYAQPEPSKQQRNQRFQQIQSAKIAFFTSELELTPKEAEEFWPVYNQYWKERETIVRRTQSTIRNINRSFKNNEQMSDQELRKQLDIYINGPVEESALHKEYYAKFIRVLPVKKVAKLYVAEEEFRIKMIHQLRSGESQPQVKTTR